MEEVNTQTRSSTPLANRPKMIGLVGLLSESFLIYKNQFWQFVKLSLCYALVGLLLAPIVAISFISNKYTPYSVLFFLLILCFFIVAIALAVCISVASIYIIKEKDRAMKVRDALKKSIPLARPFLWASFLSGLAALGGFILFIIPGIIFAVWFSFTKYAVVVDGVKGRSALMKSKQLVKGYWWPVLGRFFLVTAGAMIISYIPVVGPLINLFFVGPFITIFGYIMYQDLKALKAKM